jgi:hypothetical protein
MRYDGHLPAACRFSGSRSRVTARGSPFFHRGRLSREPFLLQQRPFCSTPREEARPGTLERSTAVTMKRLMAYPVIIGSRTTGWRRQSPIKLRWRGCRPPRSGGPVPSSRLLGCGCARRSRPWLANWVIRWRWARVVVHLVALARSRRHWRWHIRGIRREFQKTSIETTK